MKRTTRDQRETTFLAHDDAGTTSNKPCLPVRRELRGSRYIVLGLLVIGPIAFITALMWIIVYEIPQEQRDGNRQRMEAHKTPAHSAEQETPDVK